MIDTKIYIFKILIVKKDSSETMLAEIHHFLKKTFKDLSMFISIWKATFEKPDPNTTQASLTISCYLLLARNTTHQDSCNQLLVRTQLFREALWSLGYSEKDMTVSLYYTNYEHYLLLYRKKQLVFIFQKVSDFTFRLFHITVINVKYK